MLSSRYNVITFIIFLCILSINKGIFAQNRCGTETYNQLNKSKSINEFEQWLHEKIRFKNEQLSISGHHSNTIYEIPVVIHIFHNGEPIGTGTNLSIAQIVSQMEVLNEDFRRLNTDKVHTPTIFQPVASDIQVNFVLAKRNPEGLATDAIIRKKGSQSSWKEKDFKLLKKTSYWPSKDYLNIWVADLSGGHLGYAQFPQSDKLKGLETASAEAVTDGVLLDYQVFGSKEKYPSANLKTKFNKGRTTTHEIGHFLGLRHIWGDDDCATDYCDDTPIQRKSTNGCPTHPADNRCTPSAAKMFQNFMDYTNDVCMNLFSEDQKTRMRTVLEHSPRRKSLTNSLALLEPIVLNYDIGLFSVVSPSSTTCEDNILPEIIIKNYGKLDINSLKIRLIVNDIVTHTLSSNIPNLPQLSSTTLSFPATSLSKGTNTLRFEVVNINNQTDKGTHNNTLEHKVNVPKIEKASIKENFEIDINNLIIWNIDGQQTWSIQDAPFSSSPNLALAIQFYDNTNYKSEDWIKSPVMDFKALEAALMMFDYSYSKTGGSFDQLKVVISKDCGATFQTLWEKSGASLNTTNQQREDFRPSKKSEWKSASIDLSSFIGEPQVQLAFIGINDNGNNLYLDNIELVTKKGVNISLESVISPPLITADPSQDIIINVKNRGTETVQQLQASCQLSSLPKKEVQIDNLFLKPGQNKDIKLGEITSKEGIHQLTTEIYNPNDQPNAKVTTPKLQVNYAIDTSNDGVPFHITWDDDYQWTNISRPTEGKVWQSQITNYENSMTMSKNTADKSEKLWYISPAMDLSSSESPVLLLEYAYSLSGNSKEHATLQVLLSKDNGEDNFPEKLLVINNTKLATVKNTSSNWSPSEQSHWQKKQINLSKYENLKKARIAVVGTGKFSNDFFVDNIEFYKNKNDINQKLDNKKLLFFPNPISSSSGALLNLVFGLEKRQPVTIRILDLTGKVVFSQHEQYALNQTFTYDASGLPAGILILSVNGTNFQYHSRISVIR